MLKLYNKEHEVLSALTNLKDYKIEYVLSGEDLLEFSLSRYDENIPLIQEECYIRTEYNEYVIKAIEPSNNFKRFTCNINIESLVGKVIKNFDTKNNNINDTIRLAIAGTGWTLADNSISKKRTVSLKNTNALEVLRKVRETFRVDFRFDAINKIIYVYEKLGSDKGVYFTDELNLISLDVPSDSYDYATRLYAKGKNGLTFADINNGKDYIENFQYSNKIIEKIWEDNRYTNKQNLKEDAEAKLEELSKPRRNYNVQVYDLAKNNSEFSFLDFSIGDTVTIISNLEKFKDKQRIVKYIEYPEDPSQNTCELGNTTLTFEELQKENEAKNSMVDAITSDNGTIDGSKVDSITTKQISDFEASVAKITDLTVVNAEITNLKAQNVTITGKLTAVEGEFGTLKANVGVIDKLTVTHTAQINNLEANKASITQLEVVNGKINILEVNVGKIQTLVNGNLTSENIQAGGITSDKLTIANGFITNAMIANLDVSKINAGDISTNKFRIKSDDGGIEIVGATQQFKDKNNKVRIQMGQDAKGNFNFIIRGEDGTSTLIDHTGVKEKAIADDLIKENMIAQDSIGEKQIDYSSFITGFNKDTNTNTIKSTKIMLNNQNQTLDVAFSQLKTQADGTKTLTESHSTTIGVMQGQISTAINNTQIVKDGQTILLKDDYNRTVQTIDSMKSTIGSHTSQISGLNSTVSTQGSSIEQLKGQIALKVEQTDITTAINNVQIGVRNYIITDKVSTYTPYNTITDRSVGYIKSTWKSSHTGDIFTLSVTNFTPKKSIYTISGTIKVNGKIPSERYFNGLASTYGSGLIRNDYDNATGRFVITQSYPGNSIWIFHVSTIRSSGSSDIVELFNLKFEEGNKPTDWTPAPEDTQGQLDAHTTEITTVKSNVASIETNLSSITSRVSSVEQTQVSTNGKVTSLETWKKDAEKKITSDAIISTVTSSQTYKDALTGKVSTNQIISSINQTAEAIKIQANKIDMTGELDLQGRFKCWKNNSDKTGNYLHLNGAMMFGYNKTGGNNPVFASGLWTDENMGYFSVGYTRADITDANGCLYMSPQEGNQGGRLTFSRLKDSQVAHTTLYFQKDGAIDFYSGLRGLYENDDNYTYRFDAGTSVKALRCNRLRSYDIYPRGNNTYDIGFTNGGCFSNIWGNNICTNQSHLYLGTAQASGAWNTYGALAINSATGYIFPAKYNGALGLGMSNNRFSGLYSVNAVNVSSDSRLKTDIHYLEEPTGETVILENRVERNMHITTKDMYDFVKDELKLASYRYNINLEKGNTSVDYGFIAQDILYTKVGSEIVQLADENNLNSELSYNQGNYISVIAGALQQEIRKRDKEIKELRLEIENLKSQRKLEVA